MAVYFLVLLLAIHAVSGYILDYSCTANGGGSTGKFPHRFARNTLSRRLQGIQDLFTNGMANAFDLARAAQEILNNYDPATKTVGGSGSEAQRIAQTDLLNYMFHEAVVRETPTDTERIRADSQRKNPRVRVKHRTTFSRFKRCTEACSYGNHLAYSRSRPLRLN